MGGAAMERPTTRRLVTETMRASVWQHLARGRKAAPGHSSR